MITATEEYRQREKEKTMEMTPSGSGDMPHLMFANYLRMKIEEGYFPAGCVLPRVEDFMLAFKLGLTSILKAMTRLEKTRIVRFDTDSNIVVILGPEGSPLSLDVRKDDEELFGLFSLLEAELLKKAWNKIDCLTLGRIILSAKELELHEKAQFMDQAIHSELARASGSRTLIHMQNQKINSCRCWKNPQ